MNQIITKTYYSIGGGFIVEEGEKKTPIVVPHDFTSAENLLNISKIIGP